MCEASWSLERNWTKSNCLLVSKLCDANIIWHKRQISLNNSDVRLQKNDLGGWHPRSVSLSSHMQICSAQFQRCHRKHMSHLLNIFGSRSVNCVCRTTAMDILWQCTTFLITLSNFQRKKCGKDVSWSFCRRDARSYLRRRSSLPSPSHPDGFRIF